MGAAGSPLSLLTRLGKSQESGRRSWARLTAVRRSSGRVPAQACSDWRVFAGISAHTPTARHGTYHDLPAAPSRCKPRATPSGSARWRSNGWRSDLFREQFCQGSSRVVRLCRPRTPIAKSSSQRRVAFALECKTNSSQSWNPQRMIHMYSHTAAVAPDFSITTVAPAWNTATLIKTHLFAVDFSIRSLEVPHGIACLSQTVGGILRAVSFAGVRR